MTTSARSRRPARLSRPATRHAALATAALILAVFAAPIAPAEAPRPSAPGAPPEGGRLARLRILKKDTWPRAFFFRVAEGMANNKKVSYEAWESQMGRLMGIIGKCLGEEVPGRELRNPTVFTRFKEQHPDQLVLLHYNGNARDPRWDPDGFFAGHWVYHNGARILEDVPAEDGETDIRVADADLFRTGIGRYRNSNEDVGLCLLDERGRPDWRESEQVQLVSVDADKGVIRVRRGAYGTKPRAFPAGRAYAAAHATEGPWGRQSHLLWHHNYSTCCPRDAEGRTCADVLVEDMGKRFGAGGGLAAFDGIQFDVLRNIAGGHDASRRGPDCDADGRPDGGIFDGVNAYGAGVVAFCRALRERLGPDRLILADGHSDRHQRAFGILNGIESEGWPSLKDEALSDWSGGLNRHAYWARFGHAPAFNYINHKYTEALDEPGRRTFPDVPFGTHRLVFAAAQFTDSALCYSFAPPRVKGEPFPIWDELWKGQEQKTGWLGAPAAPPLRLAERAPDTLGEADAPIGEALLERFEGEAARIGCDGDAVRVVAEDPAARETRIRLRDVPCDGPDLTVFVTARAAGTADAPDETPRVLAVGVAPAGIELLSPAPEKTGLRLRDGSEHPVDGAYRASVRYDKSRTLGGEPRACLFTHPPYEGGTGYTFWEATAQVPRNATLEFFTGMGERAPGRSDGVVFMVTVAEIQAGGGTAAPRTVFEENQVASEWRRRVAPLERWAERKVRLRFIADCGPNDNATTDHAMWADARIATPADADKARTRPVRFMTWAGREAFTSVFAFSDVRSRSVDLEFSVEGTEPFWIEDVRAYAHPDAIVRVYEGGVVLANPSPRPYEFDLTALAPGMRLRRLKGTPAQDPETNNGERIDATVTLGPKDALFLARMD